jgi:hypothetical protein
MKIPKFCVFFPKDISLVLHFFGGKQNCQIFDITKLTKCILLSGLLTAWEGKLAPNLFHFVVI